MKRVFLMLYNRTSGINEAAFLLGLFTLVSQLLGLVRDRLLATYVGAGPELDAYYAAFKIPDFLFITVATLASITVLLPALTRKYGEGSPDQVKKFNEYINQIFTLLTLFLVIVSIILWVVLPLLIPLITPGFSGDHQKIVVHLARIMLAQPIIIGISSMISSITQFFKKFLITACTPVMYNMGIIIGIVLLYPVMGITGLAWGVIIGAILHLGIQIPLMIHERTLPRITFKIHWDEIWELVSVSLPRTLGLSLNTFTLIILTAVASLIGAGSIALFTLTNNMLNVPIAIIGISYSVASFPLLVRYHNDNNRVKFSEQIMQGAQKIIFWSVPVVFLFIVLRAQIVRVILGANSFSWNDTRLAAALLAVFMIGLVGQSLVHLFVRGMYAMGDTKKPLLTNAVSQVVIVMLVFVFVKIITIPAVDEIVRSLLRLQGVSDIRLIALPLAFALGNTINCILLMYHFRKKFPESSFRTLNTTLFQTLLASGVLGILTYSILQAGAQLFNQNSFWGIFLQGATAGIVGIAGGVIVLLVVKNQDIQDFINVFKKKFWKVSIVQESSEIR